MNLVNLERVSKAYGTTALLDRVTLGLGDGERVGVVGRNGGGKTTLAAVATGVLEPDGGRVTHARGLRLGYLPQQDTLDTSAAVRELLLPGWAEHEWAGDPRVREVLDGLLGGLDLPLLPGGWDASAGTLSGGERRRVALARLLTGEHDVLVLDEPTNHLDIEAIDWLARHVDARGCALVVITHDRYFLDAVCSRIWELDRGQVHRYEGGYSAYVLAKAERERLAAAAEDRRRNLLRKELAWLRRGPPARTSKPKFRVQEANALIGDEPPPRDQVELTRFATARLGKTVLEASDLTLRVGDATVSDAREPTAGAGQAGTRRAGGEASAASTVSDARGPTAGAGQAGTRRAGGEASAASTVLDRFDWQLGPGERVGVVGVNGTGKTSLLRLLAGDLVPTSGRLVRGKTVRPGYLSQDVAELDPAQRALEAVRAVRHTVRVGKREMSANQLAERFGFSGDRQWTPIGQLSGGERRRLQLLRLLMDEPNVLLLDEPTNDLDIDTLTELEDLLDSWPGSLVVVSHDRYFLERVTDHVVALLGDGKLALLPGGVEEYLQRRREGSAPDSRLARSASRRSASGGEGAPSPGGKGGAAAPDAGTGSAAAPGAGMGGASGSGGGTGGAGQRHGRAADQGGHSADGDSTGRVSAAETRATKKKLTRLERRLDKLSERQARLHEQLAEHGSDYEKLTELDGELRELTAEKERVEDAWLELAETV